MKVLCSPMPILTFIILVTLSSVVTTLGLKCYECIVDYNSSYVDPNPASLLRQSIVPSQPKLCPGVGEPLNDQFVEACKKSQTYCAHMIFKSKATGMAELAQRTCYNPSQHGTVFKRDGKCAPLPKSDFLVCACKGDLCNLAAGVEGYPTQEDDDTTEEINKDTTEDNEKQDPDTGSGSRGKGIKSDLFSLWSAVIILWATSSTGVGQTFC